jgi:hypothetical protein
VRRQKSANTKPNGNTPEKTKSLRDRYAELLKLREAVSRSQSELMRHSANVKSAGAKANRALSYH